MPVLARVAAIPLSEDAVEMGQAAEAAGKTDFGDRPFGMFQEMFGLRNPPRLDIVCEGHSDLPMEEIRQMGG